MRKCTLFGLLFLVLLSPRLFALSEDEELTEQSLKIEANHNLNRLRGFRSEIQDNKIYESEREKGLAEFLEEQEKWDLLRERGLADYRKQKRLDSQSRSVMEYEEYLAQKQTEERAYERSRRALVETRDRVRAQSEGIVQKLESEEQNLQVSRPRYTLEKRRRNKWASTGKSAPVGGSSGGYTQPAPPPPTADFPAVTDFPPAPPAYEPAYEEFPIPPVYDGNANNGVPYDPGYGGDSVGGVPPPPPPPPDFDF